MTDQDLSVDLVAATLRIERLTTDLDAARAVVEDLQSRAASRIAAISTDPNMAALRRSAQAEGCLVTTTFGRPGRLIGSGSKLRTVEQYCKVGQSHPTTVRVVADGPGRWMELTKYPGAVLLIWVES